MFLLYYMQMKSRVSSRGRRLGNSCAALSRLFEGARPTQPVASYQRAKKNTLSNRYVILASKLFPQKLFRRFSISRIQTERRISLLGIYDCREYQPTVHLGLQGISATRTFRATGDSSPQGIRVC